MLEEEEQTNLHSDLSRTICGCNHWVIYLSREILRYLRCFAPIAVETTEKLIKDFLKK